MNQRNKLHNLEMTFAKTNSIRLVDVLRIVAASVALSLLVVPYATLASRDTDVISGKVISVHDKKPIEGAFVYVHSARANDELGINEYVKTDARGAFTAVFKGSGMIRVWKPGYCIRGIDMPQSRASSPQQVIIQLLEMTSTKLVAEHEGFFDFSPGNAFSIKLGKKVDADNSDADIAIVRDASDNSTAFLECIGGGGIAFQPFTDASDFYNSPEAPVGGYQKRVNLETASKGFYFIVARDGEHYAKARLLISISHDSIGSLDVDLENTRVIWAYQSDGTRDLEIASGKNLPFPVEMFGLARDSLDSLLKEAR
jgi:hypothetical protein